MAKFCVHCGKENEDSAVFCEGCGSSFEAAAAPSSAPQSNSIIDKIKGILGRFNLDMRKAVILSGAAVVAIVALILIISLFFGPKATIRRFMSGVKNVDAEKVVSCMPSFIWEEDDDEKEDKIENIEDYLDYLEIEYCDKFTYEIVEVEKLSKKEKRDMEELLEFVEEYNDVLDVDDVTDYRTAEVKVKYTYDGDKETLRIDLVLIKYKGSWKVYSYTFD